MNVFARLARITTSSKLLCFYLCKSVASASQSRVPSVHDTTSWSRGKTWLSSGVNFVVGLHCTDIMRKPASILCQRCRRLLRYREKCHSSSYIWFKSALLAVERNLVNVFSLRSYILSKSNYLNAYQYYCLNIV